jgi:formiminotetrahydrofolate cyclodeaminase
MVNLYMADKLLDLVTKKLLEKFGAGKHKPGSGSASAFQGMISAQLLTTVIDLTNHPDHPKRRERYSGKLDELLRIREDIQRHIYPSLEQLFQEDSDLFDKVIVLRQERDDVDRIKEPLHYSNKLAAVDDALRLATELPIEIARNCYALGKHAGEVFDHGFQAARGDAGVALQGAIAAMGSCLSVIELNLTNLPPDSWMAAIRHKRAMLKAQYTELNALGGAKLASMEKLNEEKWQTHQTFGKYRCGTLGKTIRTDQDMEDLVREFQNTLWVERDKIWTDGSITDAMKVLNPEEVLQKVMGYAYQQRESLGMLAVGEELFEVAGVIDKNIQSVSTSKQFSPEVIKFTAAHELAHLILHEQSVLHRDRPFDGSSSVPKDLLETQADKFAAYFLMPAKIVKAAFFEIFETENLRIDEGLSLALGAGSVAEIRAKCKDQHGFAMFIAQAGRYASKSFNPMAKIFGVSTGAMAIRLIELDLVTF